MIEGAKQVEETEDAGENGDTAGTSGTRAGVSWEGQRKHFLSCAKHRLGGSSAARGAGREDGN